MNLNKSSVLNIKSWPNLVDRYNRLPYGERNANDLILSGEMIGHLTKEFTASWVRAGKMRLLLDKELFYTEQFQLGYRKLERNREALASIERHLCST